MTLHKEAIKVRTSPPSASHVRAYIVVLDGEPSDAQHPTPDRERIPHHSPMTITWVGVPPCQLQANLGDLADDKLQQLIEDFLLGGHSQRAECTPRDPSPTPWGNPVGNGDLDVNDWEVTFLRGGGWELIGQSLQPPAPTQLGRGWEPRGQPPCPPAPAQPNEDRGCLINTLVMGL